ncbi:MAG: hypothetical protein GXO32_08855 [Crenarchaeota archaeon]|nr:hypothetical protein [Thermoproteota archaeon]
MARYLVELVQRYFMCKSYAVRVAVPIPYRKRVGGSERIFHQFIDILAISPRETVIVECRDFKSVKRVRDSIHRLLRLFKRSLAYLESNGYRVDRAILVVDDKDLEKIEPYLSILSSENVYVLKLSEILKELVECSLKEEEYRKLRGEGDTILAIIRVLYRYLKNSKDVYESHH